MEMPSVKNELHSANQKFKLVVYAYRALSEAELKYCLAMFLKQRRLKKVPSSSTYTMVTMIGHDSQQT